MPESNTMGMLFEEMQMATSSPPSQHNYYHPHHAHHHHRFSSPLKPSDVCYTLHDYYHANGVSSPCRSSGTLSPESPEPSRRRANDLDLVGLIRAMELRDHQNQNQNHHHHQQFLASGFGSNPSPNQSPLLCQSQSLLRRCNANLIPPQQNPWLPPFPNQDPSLDGYLHEIRFGSRPPRSNGGTNGFNGLDYDDTLIIQGINGGMTYPRSNPNLARYAPVPRYDMAVKIQCSIYQIAKDQNGCRLLQRKLTEGSRKEVDMIFNGVIDHVVELMVNPFGNYLVQKLLEVCNEEQRLKVVLVLTRTRMELVLVCLNPHGTRVVQKLIETLKTGQQTGLVIAALKPGFLDLIKDLNGNHVVQRCLQSLKSEDNKFIFDAAAKHCVDIATHQHGCCVLQRCIFHSTGEQRAKLISEISRHGLHLAQDAFGNYVVQYILDLKSPVATANLVPQFRGNYVQLSMQKFSSNVVEKCLKVFIDGNQANIVLELLSFPRFDQLLQDPYANYVIQCALETTKGALHSGLVEAIKPHASILRTSPYCKRIFNRAVLKK